MSIEIRPIQPWETVEAKRVILSVAHGIFRWPETFEELQKRFDAQGELRDVDDYQSSYLDRGGIFLVALEDGRIVGTGAIRGVDSDTAELWRLWLLESHHGQGLGYRLLQALLEFARASGFGHVHLQTDGRQERAIAFYKRAGFKMSPCSSDDARDVCMDLSLTILPGDDTSANTPNTGLRSL